MPVCYPQCAGKPYRPSNGTEGEMFQEQFCYSCRLGQDEDNPCDILTRSFAFSIGDADYPKEWVHDRNGRPTCIAFHDVLSEEPASVLRCEHTLDLFEGSAT